MDYNDYNNTRTVIGYLEKPIATHQDDEGRPINGLARVLFEEYNNELYSINDEKGAGFFDGRNEVFLTAGFGKMKEQYKEQLIKIECMESRFREEDKTKYVARDGDIKKLGKHDIYSFIEADLPDPLDGQVRLKTIPKTYIFFIIKSGFALYPFRHREYCPSHTILMFSLKSQNITVLASQIYLG